MKYLVLSLILVFSVFSSLGQGVLEFGDEPETAADTNLLIEAQVLETGKPKSNVNIRILHNGVIINSAKTKSDGFFKLQIGFDTLVTLQFSESGYVTKLIEVDTRNMPQEDRVRGYDAGLFKLSMIRPDSDLPLGLYKNPIAKIVYDPISMNFVMDRAYKKKVKKSFKEADSKPDVIQF